MAAQRRDIFTTIRTEGALLPPDLLGRIADGDSDLEGLTPGTYHLSGERINEATNHAWNRLRGAWANFQNAMQQLPEDDIGTTVTRERWLLPLFRELDYGRVRVARAAEIDGKSYPISHDWENVPIHLVSYKVDLDRRTPGVAGAATTSPHSLLQVFLNRSDDHLWGFLSNGLRLRILRDNVSLTRQAYVEFDLEAMMSGEVYADFVLLWLLCHQSRVEAERPEHFWLEKWMNAAQDQGKRALDTLRNGVQQAIEHLGAGFIAHSRNRALRDKLQSGRLDAQDYYRQLLRLVYRMLFLFVAEDRDLLLLPDADEATRALYTDNYSTQRLRRMAERLRGTRHVDLFHGLRLVMRLLGDAANGDGAALGLPVLGSFLFSDEAVADIIDCQIANHDLLDAVRALAFSEDRAIRVLRQVDYKHLGPEELGSVYESLLELHPQINVDARTFALATASGHERKTTGSYYTPASLIQALLDSALDPVLDEAMRDPDREAALLDLKICDPACGSGHFLIAAANRMAKKLAEVRTGEEEPPPDAIQAAWRDVIGGCIYGVDINPMAVELCKVNLWMEALEPGKPLSFLDHRILCGNSLLGTTPKLMAGGIPSDAFKPITGDDKTVASRYRKLNRQERRDRETGQRSLFEIIEPPADYAHLAANLRELDALADDTLAGIRAKEARYRALADDPEYVKARLLADAWCAAFVWEKRDTATPPMTDLLYRRLEEDPLAENLREVRSYGAALADQYQFFHWHIAFPDVFAVPEDLEDAENEGTGWDGGFDCVLGNPPWERIKIQEKEWFAGRNDEITNAPNAAVRRRLIAALREKDPHLFGEFQADKRKAEGESHFVRQSERYPLCGRGDVNTYSVFAETARNIISGTGRVGIIVPSGIATDATTQYFFRDLMESTSLESLFSFENEEFIFPGVHHSFKFALLTISGTRIAVPHANFVFFARRADHLKDTTRKFVLSVSDVTLINPNTLTCATFRSGKDAELTKFIYHNIPIFLKHSEPRSNPWSIQFLAMFHMSGDSGLFHDQPLGNGHPLYEAKLFHFFDHRYATYEGATQAELNSGILPKLSEGEKTDPNLSVRTRYWVENREIENKLSEWPHKWLLVFRKIARSTDQRTLIASIVPIVALGDTAPVVLPIDIKPHLLACLLGNMNGFVCDYIARQKVVSTAINNFLLEQFPVLPPRTYTSALLDFITPRVLELTYTAWDLEPFARDVGWDGPPFVWDEERRFLMRCELDALYFHLYGIARDDVAYIMETFPIVKRKDIARTATEDTEGEYITKRVILEMYDQMAALPTMDVPHPKHEGESYPVPDVSRFATWLSPPPADPSVAHEPKN